MKKGWLWIIIFTVLFLFSSCGPDAAGETADGNSQVFDHGGNVTLRILSGSENRELSQILDDFARTQDINIVMDYKGSLDIMRELENGAAGYDAVWPASSLWISVGDTQHLVKHAQSVSITPVVFGIRESLAKDLGFTEREVSVSDILEAVSGGKLEFCMTSATQSNSGCCAYIGFLYALLGNPDVITSEALADPGLAQSMTSLLSGVDRSSGSSDWLKDMFLEGDYDAMVNYECLIISANQELEARGEEPLYVVYPYDGLSIADSPLGYIDNGDSRKEEAFLSLQDYLLSDDVQNQIQKTGRRTGYEGVSQENADVFRSDWGIQPDRLLSPIRMPSSEVLFECLNLYQTQFRKPSLTVYCLDYSGSMSGEGENQLEEAMAQILIQDNAAQNFLQASSDEINILIPFDSNVRETYMASGNGQEIELLYDDVVNEETGGGTNMYKAAETALEVLSQYDLSQYTPAVILLTDGMSNGSFDDFRRAYEEAGMDVPVFSIMFGDADPDQLDDLADFTNARVFDGREDLIGAFRSVKGYN